MIAHIALPDATQSNGASQVRRVVDTAYGVIVRSQDEPLAPDVTLPCATTGRRGLVFKDLHYNSVAILMLAKIGGAT